MSVTENTENLEEFIVCRHKVGVIDSVKGKIERLFGTRVYFTQTSKDGDKEKRWIKVTGGKWDRQNAKTYILGISDPEETKTIHCSADFLDNEILENIEKNTQAVLERPTEGCVKISGSELAVTLALSALEELTGCVQGADCNPSENETRDRSASKRLDEKLDQTFGEGGNSYHSYPSSIKRLFLECGTRLDEENEIISDDLLHGTGSENRRKTSSEIIVRTREPDQRKVFTAPICRAQNDGGEDIGDSLRAERGSGSVSKVTAQFPSAAQISPVPKRGSKEDILRDFAKNVGYTDEEIEEGFLYVQPPMKPTDFLDVLKRVKEEKQKLGLSESPVTRTVDDQSSRDESVVVVSDEEDEIMIVEDYFKKSADSKKQPSPKNKPGGLSNKEKKKNEQKQKSLAKEFQQQQNNPRRKNQMGSPERQETDNEKKKQALSEGENTSGTKRKSDPDSDQEQTCVMKVWESNDPVFTRDSRKPPVQRMVQPMNQSLSAQTQQTQVDPTNPWCRMPHAPTKQIPMNESQAAPYPQNRQTQAYPVPQHPTDTRPKMPPAQGGYLASHAVNFDGSPIHTPVRPAPLPKDNLRYVIIDGSNVAMFHGNNKVFSCKGIQIAVDYFLDRGHKVTVFIPEWRKYRNYVNNKIQDQEILEKLENNGNLVFTPSRKINGKLVASYDDRFILSLAEKEDSVILSNDQYRDLMREKASWKKIVEERLLMYRFVGDHFMPAEDPLGRHGPMLDEFLLKNPTTSQTAPPGAQFYQHQIRPQYWGGAPQQRLPVGHWQADGSQGYIQNGGQGHVQNRGQGQNQNPWQNRGRQANPLIPQQKAERSWRHDDVTKQLLSELKNVFSEPEQEEKLKRVLENHKTETDLNRLTNYCMEAIFQ